MVAAAPDPMEWSDLAETSSAVSDLIGCLPDRVGGCVRGSSDRGPSVSRGVADAHQLLGIDSSNASCATLCQRSIGDRYRLLHVHFEPWAL